MRSSCKAFSQLMIKGEGPVHCGWSHPWPSPLWVEPSLAQPIVGGAIPGLVDLGSIRKQAEQVRGRKPVCDIPPWPLHQLLLPDLLDFGPNFLW